VKEKWQRMSGLPSSTELRPSGIPGLDGLPWGAHFFHFYRSGDDLGKTLIPFFQAGLEANEQCFWVPSEHLPAARVRQLLSSTLPDCREREARGQLEVLEADWYQGRCSAGTDGMVRACLEREERALASGYAGVRLAGNALGAGGGNSARERAEHEARVQAAFQGHKLLAFGSFALTDSSSIDLLEVLQRQGFALLCIGARSELIQSSTARASVALAASVAGTGGEQRAERSRALETETRRRLELESERSHLVAAEHRAASLAEAALRHLSRLQRATSALSEAVSISDVCEVLRSEMADAVDAERSYAALADDEGAVFTPIGCDADSEVEPAPGPESLLQPLKQAFHERRPIWPTLDSPVVALPLLLGSRAFGAVAFELRESTELEPAQRALFEDLVRQLALALDRARMYELERQACDRAEEANRAKDEFLAVLGHELRNPLSPILTALELMRVRAGDVALKERGIIERQLRHMVRLVDDLLDVSRITRGSLRLSRRTIQLAEVVDRAIEMASPLLDAHSHRLLVSVPARGMRVDIDVHRVAQAIANLLTNAAKYTPRGGCIELTARVRGERIALEVRDDGIGIEAGLLGRIFEPFVQRQQALDRSHGGLGLGLTIARRLIESHGGTLEAASSGPGRGSTFTLELLRASRKAVETPAEEEPRAAAPPSPAAERAGLRVLVVDDNVDAAEMLAEALRVNGHVVGVAHDGPAALSLVDDFRPELALLDIGLPVMDGFDLARRLKSRLSTSPPKFVAVTGYGQASDRARTKKAGFDEHLVKPIDLAHLNAIVRDLEHRSESRSRGDGPPSS
jgi:signal transduction histidine kinase/ActR/RegA family two-component response regulator